LKYSFQYNNFQELVPTYIKKFKNFKKVITDKNYIKLIYCTRWNKNKIEDFYDIVDMFKKYNPNIHTDFVLADTSEIVKGKRVFIKAKFAKFKDAEDGIRKNIAVLLGDRYKNARLNARSPEEQIKLIAQAGYTTTPSTSYLKLMQGNIDRVRKKTGFGRIE
jgi:uncharacterized protein (DUF2132 family)